MSQRALSIGVVAALAVAMPVMSGADSTRWQFHADHMLGTSLQVSAVEPTKLAAGIAADAVIAEVRRLDAVLSDWREDSEVAAAARVMGLPANRLHEGYELLLRGRIALSRGGSAPLTRDSLIRPLFANWRLYG